MPAAPREGARVERRAASAGAFRDEELLADVITRLIGDVRHIAVGNASPIPAMAALLARQRGRGLPYVSLLQSRKHNFFTDGGRELFDCAGQGRIDVFFLSGGEIDGEGNINLVSHRRLRRAEGALSRLVRLGPSLLRGAEGGAVPHRAFAPHAGAEGRLRQRAGRKPGNVYRPGGPIALVTNRCLFSFDRTARRFRLESVHPGHTVEEVAENTGFAFDWPDDVPVTPAPSDATLRDAARRDRAAARRGLSAIRRGVVRRGRCGFLMHVPPRMIGWFLTLLD